MEEEVDIIAIGEQLARYSSTKRNRILRMITQAALGSIPWVGGVMGAMATYKADEEQATTDSLQRQWLEEHAKKIQELAATLGTIIDRLDSFGDSVKERIESEEYLAVVRQGFKAWDDAATEQKKRLISQMVTNAGISRVCSDDVIRLFQDWIGHYHEIHFSVIGTIFQHPGWSRYQVWRDIRGATPREDSAEADLFRLLIRDLSTGGIIRQRRETNYHGQFLKKQTKAPSTTTMKSAFDPDEAYELTELGKQFVHYTMEELVPRLTNEGS